MTAMTPAQHIELIGKEIIRLKADQAVIQDKIDHLLDQLADYHQAGDLHGGKNDAGAIRVTVRQGAARLDTKKIEDLYPVTQRPDLYTPKIDTKKIRSAFAPNELAAWETRGAPTISVDNAR